MPKKKKQQDLPVTLGIRTHKETFWILGVLILVAGSGGWAGYDHHRKVQADIRQYETAMNKEIYSPCAVIDEEGTSKYATTTYWDENDPELKGFPREEGTGMYLPMKDKNGKMKEPPTSFAGEIKDEHFAYIRGSYASDGYGQSRCIPCSKVIKQEQVNICNDKNAYYELNNEQMIDDLNDVDPSLIKEIPNQQSEEEITDQQSRVWTDAMTKAQYGTNKETQKLHEPRSSY